MWAFTILCLTAVSAEFTVSSLEEMSTSMKSFADTFQSNVDSNTQLIKTMYAEITQLPSKMAQAEVEGADSEAKAKKEGEALEAKMCKVVIELSTTTSEAEKKSHEMMDNLSKFSAHRNGEGSKQIAGSTEDVWLHGRDHAGNLEGADDWYVCQRPGQCCNCDALQRQIVWIQLHEVVCHGACGALGALSCPICRAGCCGGCGSGGCHGSLGPVPRQGRSGEGKRSSTDGGGHRGMRLLPMPHADGRDWPSMALPIFSYFSWKKVACSRASTAKSGWDNKNTSIALVLYIYLGLQKDANLQSSKNRKVLHLKDCLFDKGAYFLEGAYFWCLKKEAWKTIKVIKLILPFLPMKGLVKCHHPKEP